MSDEKRKKSWREVDKSRDQSRNRRSERPGTDPYTHRRNTSYKAELDRFFDKGVASDRIKDLVKQAGAPDAKAESETPERVKLIRRVRTAETFDDFVKSLDALRAGDGLPNDVDLLVRALEHPAEEVIRDALSRLSDLANRIDLTTMKAIRGRLDSLDNICEEKDTLELMARLREKLFGQAAD